MDLPILQTEMRRGVGLEPREAWRCSTRFGLPKRVPLYFTGPWSLLLALALAVPPRACSEFARPPVLFLLAPTDGEVVSSLPIVLSYRVMGVDSVEIYCDGRLQYRHDADRDGAQGCNADGETLRFATAMSRSNIRRIAHPAMVFQSRT